MRDVGREEEHFALVDGEVAVGGRVFGHVYYAEEHGAFVLVEPFCGAVDVVVGAGVGAADDLEGGVSAV